MSLQIGPELTRRKTIDARSLLALGLAFFLLLTDVPMANAVVCAAGVYRAGCVGPHGAAVVRRPAYYHPVYGRRCYWRAGVRVCR